MPDGISSVIDIHAGVVEDIEEEDERAGWSDGPDAVLSTGERAVFDALVTAYRMPDDEDDSCPVCGNWTCGCVR